MSTDSELWIYPSILSGLAWTTINSRDNKNTWNIWGCAACPTSRSDTLCLSFPCRGLIKLVWWDEARFCLYIFNPTTLSNIYAQSPTAETLAAESVKAWYTEVWFHVCTFDVWWSSLHMLSTGPSQKGRGWLSAASLPLSLPPLLYPFPEIFNMI
jgi:hypothetical protein